MNKQELDILGKAFECEVNGALSGSTGIFQSKSKVAEKLCIDGYLIKSERQAKGVLPMIIRGYELTHAGRFVYCNSEAKK
jgi:hypothetical protein